MFRILDLARVHQAGSRNTAISMLAPMPTAHTLPRLAMPGLLDQASEPNPAMAVPPHSSSARPIERRTRRKSPPCRRSASCMKML